MTNLRKKMVQMEVLEDVVDVLHLRLSDYENLVKVYMCELNEAEEGSWTYENAQNNIDSYWVKSDFIRRIEKLLEKTYL